jgi:undecaprenyl-diphosphatase
VHGATVLSTLFVFWRDIVNLFRGLLRFRLNDETKYIFKLIISMIPVAVVGIFAKEVVEKYFAGDMVSLGLHFMITASLLAITLLVKPKDKPITYFNAFIIGMAQAIAVAPAISRSGATISAGLLLGNRRDEIARFSFLMVLVPVVGANIMEVRSGDFATEGTPFIVVFTGFIVAFISGYFACKWMVAIVKRGNMGWFAAYCLLIGIISILLGLHVI